MAIACEECKHWGNCVMGSDCVHQLETEALAERDEYEDRQKIKGEQNDKSKRV